MYSLVIMDDMEEAAQEAQRAVEASPLGSLFSIIRVANSAELKILRGGGAPCDVLIADIRLGDDEQANGIRAVRELFGRGCATQVIYLTGYIEYCTEVYETDHVYFLTKPICQVDFDRALARAVEGLKHAASENLMVKHGHTVIAVPCGEVTFIESRLRKLEIHTVDGVHHTYGTIPDIMGALPRGFVRTHKSFVVNLAHVTRLDPDEFVLCSGEVVPVSKRRKREVREAFFGNLGR